MTGSDKPGRSRKQRSASATGFLGSSALTFGSKFLGLAMAFVASVIVARVLGPELRGILALAVLIPSLINLLISNGLASATAFNLASRRFSAREAVGSGLVVSIAAGLLGVAVGAGIIAIWGGSLVPGAGQSNALLALLVIPPAVAASTLTYVPLGLREYLGYNFATLAGTVGVSIGSIAGVLLVRDSPAGAIVGQASAQALLVIVLVVWYWRRYGAPLMSDLGRFSRVSTSYGGQVSFGQVVTFLNYRADIFLIGILLDPRAVGAYAIAFAVAEKLSLFSSAAGTVLFPQVAKSLDASAPPEDGRTGEFSALVTRSVLLVTTALALLLLVLAPSLVEVVYSSRYAASIRPLQTLLPGIVVLGGARVLANDIAGRGRPMLNAFISLAGLMVNVILNLQFLPALGITGAALASTASYSFIFIATLLVYWRLTGLSPQRIVTPRKSDFLLYGRHLRALLSRIRGRTSPTRAGTEGSPSESRVRKR